MALEKLDRDEQAWQENRQRVMDWYSQRRDQQERAAQDMGNTDEALKLYNRVHQAVDQPQVRLGARPQLEDYYKPSDSQKTGEIAYVAGGMVVVVYLASKFI